jgi:hypothetical protein
MRGPLPKKISKFFFNRGIIFYTAIESPERVELEIFCFLKMFSVITGPKDRSNLLKIFIPLKIYLKTLI